MFTTVCNSSPRESEALFWLPRAPACVPYTLLETLSHACTYFFNLKNICGVSVTSLISELLSLLVRGEKLLQK